MAHFAIDGRAAWITARAFILRTVGGKSERVEGSSKLALALEALLTGKPEGKGFRDAAKALRGNVDSAGKSAKDTFILAYPVAEDGQPSEANWVDVYSMTRAEVIARMTAGIEAAGMLDGIEAKLAAMESALPRVKTLADKPVYSPSAGKRGRRSSGIEDA